jgi:hypothetical protein
MAKLSKYLFSSRAEATSQSQFPFLSVGMMSASSRMSIPCERINQLRLTIQVAKPDATESAVVNPRACSVRVLTDAKRSSLPEITPMVTIMMNITSHPAIPQEKEYPSLPITCSISFMARCTCAISGRVRPVVSTVRLLPLTFMLVQPMFAPLRGPQFVGGKER